MFTTNANNLGYPKSFWVLQNLENRYFQSQSPSGCKAVFSLKRSLWPQFSWTFCCDFLKNSYFWEQILNFTNNNFTRCVRRMLWFFSEWLFFRTSLNVCSISFINHANQLQMQKCKSPPLLNWFQSDLINSNNVQTKSQLNLFCGHVNLSTIIQVRKTIKLSVFTLGILTRPLPDLYKSFWIYCINVFGNQESW